jgi:hypothetical protein
VNSSSALQEFSNFEGTRKSVVVVVVAVIIIVVVTQLACRLRYEAGGTVPVHTPHPTVSQLFSIYAYLLQVFLPVMLSACHSCYITRQWVNGPNYAGVLGFRIV